ncbi:S8 family serine peptidase [Raineya orbicola]|jgi:subtilisin family serine protease|uniref:Subtilase family n=1 Tax=Raineya orbicola TaxID=2016530 RepID=A0A2N3IIK5_9BACT|nr:S8 family serine peptidase [Raineya orbicola]PKQ70144.1 Subtilase family [Raineya orbicola]
MAKNKIFGFWVVFVLVSHAFAQEKKFYFIPFKDKNGTPYQIDNPSAFLSSKAVEKKKKWNIAINDEDLPVSPSYVSQVKNTGATLQYASKWLNGVVALCNETQINQIKTMPFVKTEGIKVIKPKPTTESEKQKNNKRSYKFAENKESTFTKNFGAESKDYGYSFTQIQQIGADVMHRKGFFGEGIVIAVFDSGFADADKQTYFRHLFENGQILGTYDFVMNEPSVFEDDSHGRMVLSCIAAWQKGEIIGTAPKAKFYLFRTEDASSEYQIEEYNWLAAAEKADSLGVDIISSSLGYNKFDDTSTSYNLQNMDGKTAISTIAAEKAAQKGIIVVSSAGNEGGSSWNKITAPADASSILSIGAVTNRGTIAFFSSQGYTEDGRVKPDVLAMGSSTVVGASDSQTTTSSGTSFACPLAAGLVAGFWQANPQLSPKQVVEYIRRSGNQYEKPDPVYGYGIMSFVRADYLAKKETTSNGIMTGQNPDEITFYPNPVRKNATDTIPRIAWGASYQGKNIEIQIFSSKGKKIFKATAKNVDKETSLPDISKLPAGEYILTISPNYSSKPSWKIVLE